MGRGMEEKSRPCITPASLQRRHRKEALPPLVSFVGHHSHQQPRLGADLQGMDVAHLSRLEPADFKQSVLCQHSWWCLAVIAAGLRSCRCNAHTCTSGLAWSKYTTEM
jgi:hypothetical protein